VVNMFDKSSRMSNNRSGPLDFTDMEPVSPSIEYPVEVSDRSRPIVFMGQTLACQ